MLRQLRSPKWIPASVYPNGPNVRSDTDLLVNWNRDLRRWVVEKPVFVKDRMAVGAIAVVELLYDDERED